EARVRASSLTELVATATTKNAPNATQLRLSATVNRPTGGRWKKLNAAAPNTDIATPNHKPQYAETITTPNRYTTPSDETVVTCLSGYTRTVQTATNRTAATAPAAAEGRRPRNRIGSTPRCTTISVPPTPRTTQIPRIALEPALNRIAPGRPSKTTARASNRSPSKATASTASNGGCRVNG